MPNRQGKHCLLTVEKKLDIVTGIQCGAKKSTLKRICILPFFSHEHKAYVVYIIESVFSCVLQQQLSWGRPVSLLLAASY